MRTKLRYILFITALALSATKAFAQDVIVNITPIQQVLPPQVMLYLANPGKYFTLQLTNTTSEPQYVHLGIQIEQFMPDDGLSLSTPANRQPSSPIVVPANSQIALTSLEMKHLFDHIPQSEISCPKNLFDDYANGKFGLLPEGQYRAHITAYKWSNPQMVNPVVVSNPNGGQCIFTVCYKAQAPMFLLPSTIGAKEEDVAEVDPLNALFNWTIPAITCNSNLTRYEYSMRVVEIPQGWSVTHALERAPTVYQRNRLYVPQCIIPQNIILSEFNANKRYVAQVTAQPAAGNPLDYVMIENNGKSEPIVFRIKTSDEPEENTQKEEDKNKDEKDKDKDDKDKDKDDKDTKILFGGTGLSEQINPDSLYTFKNPRITSPHFMENGGNYRKLFAGDDVDAKWESVRHLGGEGLQADTLEFSYTVELFNGGKDGDKESALKTKPLITQETKDLKYSIDWNSIMNKVGLGDLLLLRVTPKCTKGHSVAFVNDTVNIVDFGYIERLSKKYFECSSTTFVEDKTATNESASALKGKTVAIGEYTMTIDEIEKKSSGLFKGKGRVEWTPMGLKVGICVKFDDLGINKSHIVYQGKAEGYADPSKENITDMQAVEKLFSDWGIDNLIGETGLTSRDQLTNAGVGDIAKQLKLSKYYKYIKTGQGVLKGNIDQAYMPISLPKSVNSSPVDIQIVGMTFAADYATMNIMGEFTLPNTSYTDNEILVLGAPRICISPEKVIPESGTLALLSDFTIKDPDSSFDMMFKAPKNVITPTDGCYVAWHDYKFEILGIDVDMTIPHLKKDVNGTATTEKPKMHVQASIADWDDFLVDDVSIDNFQVDDLPGWTFKASDIVYDHSKYRNSSKMGKFPSAYVKSKAGIVGSDYTWEGLYIKTVGVQFPKSLEIGTGTNKRLSISADNMFFDKSGATLELGANDVLSAKTGKLGGWSFSLDNINLTFIQNDFKNCKFNGKFDVPLLDGKIAYTCNILRLVTNGSPNGNYAYIFKTQQVDGLSLDFFLAKATWDKKQTYMLVEATPKSTGSDLETKVELLMGGDITIGGTDYLNKVLKNKLPMNFSIPGVHFSHMRIANCSEWTSKYEKALQEGGKQDSKGTTLYSGKEVKVNNQCYFYTGRWSLASAEKTLGPFSLSLENFTPTLSNNKLSTSIVGKIKLISGVDFSAKAGITISANLKNATSISNIKLEYSDTKFDEINLNSSFAGITLKGSLKASSSTEANKSEGYSGLLKITLPGDLFTVDTNGGFYKYASGSTKYSWGFFNIKLGSATGLHLDPVVINSIKGGFYFNCKKNGSSATPQNGLIGVIAGMGLSTTAGKEMLNGDFDVTVVYDKAYKRLTTFMFEGSLKAVSGLVDSKASIVYQHDNTDKFFALNVTVDAKADGAKLANQYAGEYNRLGNLMKQLNSGYEKAVGNVKGGLKGKIDDTSNSNKGHTTKAKGGDSSVKASAGATITLDFKITMKKNGKTCSPTKWHLYLGEPEISKRCSLTLIDFKSKIVNVKIGANAYLCIGNELPNNGQLPAIPTEVSSFLNGSSKGSGVVSDDISKANAARTRALQDFKADSRGGVMLGAQVFGYVDVDLGIFYGNMGATAGFDMSVQKLASNAQCTNLGRAPGWNNWYGEGQLYAYLYAKFGIRVNLGFFKKDFDIVDAGIGGVLNMGGPKPTYFTGKARVKLRLLNGLVNMNRSFKFECGDRCDLFLGNALDNFQLFGECSIADTTMTNGWNTKNKINPTLFVRPTISTDAPINEHFRVLDETELSRLSKQFDADKEQLKSLASRTFVFRTNNYVILYEYKSKSDKYPTKRYYYFKGDSRSVHSLDMMTLNPNRFYKMEVIGWAKEIEQGREVDPVYYDTKTGKYTHKAWAQTKTYYFCTGDNKAIEDVVDLQEYVALAYPSYYNQIKDIKTFQAAYIQDVEAPTIALNTYLCGKAFTKGKLKWILYDEHFKKLDEVDNQWWINTNHTTCNMQPKRKFTNVSSEKYYYIYLIYETSTKDKNGKVTVQTTTLAKLPVHAKYGTWRTGYNNSNNRVLYDKPFVAARLNNVTWKTSKPGYASDKSISQAEGTKQGGKLLRLSDPYWYISFLTNYAFVGGWELSASRIKAAATTSQSLIYTTEDGVYEGTLGKGVSYNIYNQYEKIRQMSIFDSSQYSSTTWFPLPNMTSNSYNYVNSGMARTPVPEMSGTNLYFVRPILQQIYTPYVLADRISSKISDNCEAVYKLGGDTYKTEKVDKVEDWNNVRVGTYASVSSGNSKLEIPYYQFPILWGSQFANKDSRKKVTMWGAFDDMEKSDERGHEDLCEEIYYGFFGGTMDHKVNGSKNRSKETFTVDKDMKARLSNANFTIYRVNTYNFSTGNYSYISGLQNGNTFETFDLKEPLNQNWTK